MASLCHPWFTTTNFSYRFPIFETSATTLCGTTGILFQFISVWSNIAVCYGGCKYCMSSLLGSCSSTTRLALPSFAISLLNCVQKQGLATCAQCFGRFRKRCRFKQERCCMNCCDLVCLADGWFLFVSLYPMYFLQCPPLHSKSSEILAYPCFGQRRGNDRWWKHLHGPKAWHQMTSDVRPWSALPDFARFSEFISALKKVAISFLVATFVHVHNCRYLKVLTGRCCYDLVCLGDGWCLFPNVHHPYITLQRPPPHIDIIWDPCFG